MEISVNDLYNLLANFFWIFARVSGVFLAMPIIGTKLVPVRIRLLLALSISVFLLNILELNTSILPFSIESIIVTVYQFIIGIAIGFCLQMFIQAFILLGELIAMQSGLGFAVLNDPSTNSSVPMVSQLFLMMVTFFFFIFDGHIAVIKLMKDSFYLMPIGNVGLDPGFYKEIVLYAKVMFATSLQIALPVVTSLMMLQITIGVMTKAAPQVNVFTVGFPVTMIVGIVIVYLNIDAILPHFIKLFDESVLFIRRGLNS